MENKPTNQSAQENEVHLKHCYQGEYEDSCKYGEKNCPARNQSAQEVDLEKEIIKILDENLGILDGNSEERRGVEQGEGGD